MANFRSAGLLFALSMLSSGHVYLGECSSLINTKALAMINVDALVNLDIPAEVRGWTETIKSKLSEDFNSITMEQLAQVAPASDKLHEDEHKCGKFISDIMNAFVKAGFVTAAPRDDGEEFKSKTKAIKENLTACLLLWNLSDGKIGMMQYKNYD